MGNEGTTFRPLALSVEVAGQCPRMLCGVTKNASLPAWPGNSTIGEEILNAPSGRLCEEASCYRGLEDLCAQANTVHLIGSGSWGDMERSRVWLIENLGLYALRPDAKRIPEDLKAKMSVRINTRGV
jgi:hypothetical protein